MSSCFGLVSLCVEWVVDVLSISYEMRIVLMVVILVCFQCWICSILESFIEARRVMVSHCFDFS